MQAQRVPDWGANYAAQAQAIIDSAHDEHRAQLRAEAQMADDFTHAAISQRMSDVAYFAPRDYAGKLQTVGAVMAESLDYGNGPSMDDAMRLIAHAATGADVADMARSLLNRMADAYAHYNAEAEAWTPVNEVQP